ncbi:MAG: TerB family tellurite resistance protein [Cyclobacteriaceae bacterium]|nr:TerB family tellurite resistance protein [Cyclobacteriaceae bacterium]
MRGFFEHQFLSFKKRHLRNLISLAKADGEFHESETEMVYRMGRKYGLKDRQIEKLIGETKEFELYIPESHNERMDQLYDIMQIIYADGKVDPHEVLFCEDIVKKFGYNQDMVDWLIEMFASQEVVTPQEWDEAKKEAELQFKE